MMKMNTACVMSALGLGAAILASAGCTQGHGYPGSTYPAPAPPMQPYATQTPGAAVQSSPYGAPAAAGSPAAPPTYTPSPSDQPGGPPAGAVPAYEAAPPQ